MTEWLSFNILPRNARLGQLKHFISENNPTLYADKIVDVLNDEKLYNKVSRNAYKKVYRTWDDIVKDSFKLYLDWIYKYRK